jgi:hypothetical protein
MTESIVPANFVFDADTIRPDGLVNITSLSSAYFRSTGKRKDTAKWLTSREATESIAYLERVTQKSVSELVIVEHGIGTWVHPDLAEIFAQWISVEYRFAVVRLIRKTKERLAVVQPKLPSRQLALETAVAIDKIQDILAKTNPRLAQVLVDCAMNDVLDLAPAAIVAAQDFPEDRWYGLVQIATKMGVKTDASSRVKLGLNIGKRVKELNLERVREQRLCNGQLEDIWCYRDNEVVRGAIQEWFDSTNADREIV